MNQVKLVRYRCAMIVLVILLQSTAFGISVKKNGSKTELSFIGKGAFHSTQHPRLRGGSGRHPGCFRLGHGGFDFVVAYCDQDFF